MKIIVTSPKDRTKRIIIQAPVNPETGVRYQASRDGLIKRADANQMRQPGDNIQVIGSR